MKRTKKVGSTGRYGARYGTLVRKKILRIEKVTKAKVPCPRCRTKKIFRVSAGIWKCRKCELKFAGGAYRTETASGRASKRITIRLARLK